MSTLLIAFDYSLNSPSMASIVSDLPMKLSNIKTLVITKDPPKKTLNQSFDFRIVKQNDSYSSIEHYADLASHFISEIEHLHFEYKTSNIVAAFENYAFGVRGNYSYKIAEATGILKYELYVRNIPVTVYPPTTIKKFATGKGNSNKVVMYEFFVQKFGETAIKTNMKVGQSPFADIVDSIWTLNLLYENFKKEKIF